MAFLQKNSTITSTSTVKPQWVLLPAQEGKAQEIAADLGINIITARILAQRLPDASIDEVRAFLRPSLMAMTSPRRMRGMDIAAPRIAKAIKNREKIVVFGDYDADGVTATAVLLRIFQALGHPAAHYLPSRIEEGYGLSMAFVNSMIESGVNLVITVDCGTSEGEKIKLLMDAGVEVIVSDHHEPGGQELPPALAVINPKRDDATYPFRELTGAGVAFKLAWGICEEVVGGDKVGPALQKALMSLLPLVAIGTIADVAPMIEENRILVSYGLNVIAAGEAGAGLEALLEVSRVQAAQASSRDIGFAVAPRLNAAGRLGAADLALELLIEDDPERAMTLSLELDEKNRARQALCQKTLKRARELVESTTDLQNDSVILVCADDWHEGVIGIVAGRLSDDYNLPAAVVSFNGGEERGKGSARGVPGLNLYEAINHSRERLVTFGGHEQAAGFTITRAQVDTFRKELNEQCRQQIAERRLTPKLDIDCEVDLCELNDALVREMKLLAPFGEANPAPLFICRKVRVSGTPRLIGRENKHFTFNAAQNRTAYRAVVFNDVEPLERIDRGCRSWDIVFSLSFNEFYTPARLELRIKDMRPAE